MERDLAASLILAVGLGVFIGCMVRAALRIALIGRIGAEVRGSISCSGSYFQGGALGLVVSGLHGLGRLAHELDMRTFCRLPLPDIVVAEP